MGKIISLILILLQKLKIDILVENDTSNEWIFLRGKMVTNLKSDKVYNT